MAIKHNNIVPNVHFRKWWQRYIKTWFNQAGRKKARRDARMEKAKKAFPRPTSLLRPAVRPATVRYNFKLREGRGFTFDELKEAGVSKYQARSIGIAVDHRRRNHCEESLKENVARLLAYKEKLVLFPAKAGAKHVKKGDSVKADVEAAKLAGKQDKSKVLMPIVKSKKVAARKITAEETAAHPKIEGLKAHSAYRILRKAQEDRRNVGRKIRRARAAAEKKIN
jgi:large subunit ribosomal protein L13e